MMPILPTETSAREIVSGSLRFPVTETGTGALVLCLGRHGALTKTHYLLAEHRRIVRMDMAALADQAAGSVLDPLRDAAASLASEPFDLVAEGLQSSLGLRFALRHPALLRSLILLGPRTIAPDGGPASETDRDLLSRFSAIGVPCLAVFGTRDRLAPPEAGHYYREYAGRCNLILVYDATDAMLDERPEAVASLMRDFLERQDLFLVRRESDMIYP
jgi:pimeloyl-ACP methyl ester carboxylesterase